MGKEPGHIETEFRVELPQPRQKKAPAFEALVDRIYGAIAGRTEPEAREVGTPPGAPGMTRILPRSSVDELAGMLEVINQDKGHYDLYLLEADLGIEMADLMQTVEMGEMMGFVDVKEGDIHITPLGQTFAEASILTRKEIFRNRARRMPMIRWVIDMLRSAPDGSLPWKLFYTALSPEFPDELAERQLDIAIDWGRYAELIDYDDRDQTLSLDPSDGKTVASVEKTS
jgi:NitT/TauT family transport system ATP-binding protein